MAGPLSHIKVLDLSRILAGPWAGQILADLGAQVIKVERPGAGDDTRSWGPPYLKDRDGNDTSDAGYYLAANRGKKSVTVDIALPEGQEIVRRLAADVDIVLENYKAGTLARYGLDYAGLKAVKPDLIYCSVTGFGQDGPRAHQAAYDFMIQAMGGLMSVTGERDDLPGGGPQKVGIPVVDILTGVYTSTAVLAALAHRDKTGEGDYIDIAMLDVLVGCLANQGMNYLVSGQVPRRAGNKHPNIQPQDVFPCRDGYVVVVVGNDGQFKKFAAAIGRPELSADPRFILNADRVRNQAELLPAISAILQTRDMQEWADLLDAAGVPCSAINTVPDALNERQIVARKMLVEVEHPAAGKVKLIASPLRFTHSPIEYNLPPPQLGQHTAEVLAGLGYSADEIAGLTAKGAV